MECSTFSHSTFDTGLVSIAEDVGVSVDEKSVGDVNSAHYSEAKC